LVLVPERGRGRRSRQVKGQNANVKMQNGGRGRWARVCSDRSAVGSEGHRARRTRKSKCKYQNAKCPEAESATNEGAKEGQLGNIFVKTMMLRTCSTGSNGLCEKGGRCRTEARSGGWGKGRTRGCSLAKSGREGEDWAWGWGSGWTGGWAEDRSGCRAGRRTCGMRRGRGGTMGRRWGEVWSRAWSEDRSSSKARARSRLCSCARGDAKAGGCSGAKGSPNHPADSHEKGMRGEREEGEEGVSARRTEGYRGMSKSQ
jgi:hypothetical protein